jgi:hypothetical protein
MPPPGRVSTASHDELTALGSPEAGDDALDCVELILVWLRRSLAFAEPKSDGQVQTFRSNFFKRFPL